MKIVEVSFDSNYTIGNDHAKPFEYKGVLPMEEGVDVSVTVQSAYKVDALLFKCEISNLDRRTNGTIYSVKKYSFSLDKNGEDGRRLKNVCPQIPARIYFENIDECEKEIRVCFELKES